MMTWTSSTKLTMKTVNFDNNGWMHLNHSMNAYFEMATTKDRLGINLSNYLNLVKRLILKKTTKVKLKF